MEIIDRDWYRGETKGGAAGIFPSSFVRIVDAFPGDAPSAEANVKPYLGCNSIEKLMSPMTTVHWGSVIGHTVMGQDQL